MSLRRDFAEHKNMTIESFSLVSTDISSINVNLVNIRTMLASFEDRISQLNSKVQEAADAMGTFRADIEQQNSRNSRMEEKIEDLNVIVKSTLDSIESNVDSKVDGMTSALETRISSISSNNKKLSNIATSNSNALKELMPRSKSQSARTRKLSSAVRESQEEIRKVKNLISRKLKSIRRMDAELEKKIKSQRRRIAQLNNKIELSAVKKISGRRIKKTITKKIATKKITPNKTITIIKTPKRKITKTNPKTKEVYEVIEEKNPLI